MIITALHVSCFAPCVTCLLQAHRSPLLFTESCIFHGFHLDLDAMRQVPAKWQSTLGTWSHHASRAMSPSAPHIFGWCTLGRGSFKHVVASEELLRSGVPCSMLNGRPHVFKGKCASSCVHLQGREFLKIFAGTRRTNLPFRTLADNQNTLVPKVNVFGLIAITLPWPKSTTAMSQQNQ